MPAGDNLPRKVPAEHLKYLGGAGARGYTAEQARTEILAEAFPVLVVLAPRLALNVASTLSETGTEEQMPTTTNTSSNSSSTASELPGTPASSSNPNSPSPGNQPVAGGRGSNNLKIDQEAQGDHTVFQRDDNGDIYKYQEFNENPRNPNRFDSGKRFDGAKKDGTPGAPHFNKSTQESVPTPHVNDKSTPGGVRLPEQTNFHKIYVF